MSCGLGISLSKPYLEVTILYTVMLTNHYYIGGLRRIENQKLK